MVWITIAGASIVLLTAGLLGHLDRPFEALAALWRRARPRPAVPDTMAVETLVADLRRLADLLELTYRTEEPAKMARLTAVALAYDYVLVSACRTLELPQPEHLPMDPFERLQTEAALARSGLDW